MCIAWVDRWVDDNISAARTYFEKLGTVQERSEHVILPVLLNGKTVLRFTPKLLKPMMEKKRFVLAKVSLK